MKKLSVLIVLVFASLSFGQYYPYFAYPTGYIMNANGKAMDQNIASMANWWGAKMAKITDTCPQTLTTARWGADSLACYKISNFSGSNITLRYLGWNNRTDTIPVVVPAGYSTEKLDRVWKIVGSTVTSATLDSVVLWFQNIKKIPDEQ